MSKSKQSIPPCAVFSKPNQDDSSQVDMYVLGSIPDIDWNTWELINDDTDFINEFKSLESQYDRINIWINSPGGVITDGLAMINTIRNSKKDVHTYNLGLAASMGAVLLLSGKTVHASATSIIMLHNAFGAVYGNKDDIRDYADMLEVYESAIAKSIARKTGETEQAIIEQYFDGKDHFMTGDDAHDKKLVDVLEDYEVDLPDNATNMSYSELANHFTNHKPTQTMSLKDWFGASNSDETKEVKIPASELNKLKADAQEAVNQLEVLTNEKNQLQEQVTNLQTELSTAKASLKAEQEGTATLQAALTETQNAFEAFKKGSGDEHTTVNHEEDTVTGGAKPKADYQIKEEEVRERAFNSQNNKASN